MNVGIKICIEGAENEFNSEYRLNLVAGEPIHR